MYGDNTKDMLSYDSNKFEGVLTDAYSIQRQFVFGIMEKDSIRMYRSSKGDHRRHKMPQPKMHLFYRAGTATDLLPVR